MRMPNKLKEIFETCLIRVVESKISAIGIMLVALTFVILFLAFFVIKFIKWAWLF